MTDPVEVLSQLLSASQADVLDSGGRDVWAAASGVLEKLQNTAPVFTIDGARLVMPDEVTGEFAGPHLALPLDFSTDQDQNGRGYLTFGTAAAAAYLDSQADNPEDEEQQTIVIASTVLGQVLQAVNGTVFSRSGSGLLVALDDTTANTMPATLQALEDPCLLLSATLSGKGELSLTLILPATTLDIVATALATVKGGVEDPAAADEDPNALPADLNLDLLLTQDDLEAAELLDMDDVVDEPVAPVRMAAPPREEPAGGPSRAPRGPLPLPGAQRARFAPLADPEPAATRSRIDLLAGLQMNVSVELGRAELTVAEVLELGPGSVIELDRLAGEPVDILVNDRLIARGEVVVVDENFGIRVVEVVRRGVEVEERVG